jgi:cell division protein FtsW
MMLIGRVPWRQIGRLVGIIGVTLSLLITVIVVIPPSVYENVPGTHRFSTWQSRIKGFFEDKGAIPAAKFDIDKDAQVAHANIAIATSNVIGKMPGNSVQRDFLSQAFSDFIFAIVIEELGLLGGAFIVMLYLWLLIRAGRIAKRSDKHFPAFLVMGIALLLVSQAMLNMMVAVGLFPVTGQPLPLISKGGTSTLINCAYIGMILSVSRYVADKEAQHQQEEMQANDEKLQAAAQALVLQAREIIQNENENNDEILTEALQTVQANGHTGKEKREESEDYS